MRRTRDLRVAAVVTFAFSVALAACSSSSGSGEASKTASQIASNSKAAMSDLTSVRIVGTVPSSGQRVRVAMTLTQGTSSGTFALDGGAMQLIVSGSNIYVRANESFWVNTAGVPASVAPRIADKWVTGLPSSATSGLTSSLSLKGFISSTFNNVTLTKGPLTTVGGQSAIPLTGSDGSVGYVAAEGSPYLLKVSAGTSSTKGSVVFSEFNDAKAPKVPTDAVNISALSL
jgi:hypothetical protein